MTEAPETITLTDPEALAYARAIDTETAVVAEREFRITTSLRWYEDQLARHQRSDYEEKVQEHYEELAAVRQRLAVLHSAYAEHRWSRFFLVQASNGHVHRSLNCHTTYATTQWAWLPQLSGLTEAEAVADQGEILCSVCFPSAPVAWTTGTSKADQAAKAERAAKKAERAAKKAAKALVPEDVDGGLLVVTGPRGIDQERITTIAAAKAFLTDAIDWNSAYPRTDADGTVRHHHPSYPPEAVTLVAEVLAARIDSTPEAEIAAAQKRAAKRR